MKAVWSAACLLVVAGFVYSARKDRHVTARTAWEVTDVVKSERPKPTATTTETTSSSPVPPTPEEVQVKIAALIEQAKNAEPPAASDMLLEDIAARLKANPEDEELINQLYSITYKNKRIEEGVRILEQVYDQANGKTNEIQKTLGEMYLDVGRPLDAVKMFQAIVAKSPSSSNESLLATGYLESKNGSEAVAAVERARAKAKTEPYDRDVYFDYVYRDLSLDYMAVKGQMLSKRFDAAERELDAAEARVVAIRRDVENQPPGSGEGVLKYLTKQTERLDQLRAELVLAH